MRLFRCQHCKQLLYFENIRCENCHKRLGYLPSTNSLRALDPDGQEDGSGESAVHQIWHPVGQPEEGYRFCANAQHDACNWLIPASSDDQYCAACRHNEIIPDLADPVHLTAWRRIESAKHRLFYSLFRLGLPLVTRQDDPVNGLVFDFLDDPPGGKVLTGHDNGRITLALREADDAEREKLRGEMQETYRTLLGHFRHEIGHYYWDRLVRDQPHLDAFRELFGDERADYEQALQAHYQNGPPSNWQENFVSSYATTHPWEDFAETWAHYLHIIDTLETASVYGLAIHAPIKTTTPLNAEIDFDPYEGADLPTLLEAWFPLTFAVNSLNRSMGQPDLYPFVLSPSAIQKLEFVHMLVQAQRVAPEHDRLAA